MFAEPGVVMPGCREIMPSTVAPDMSASRLILNVSVHGEVSVETPHCGVIGGVSSPVAREAGVLCRTDRIAKSSVCASRRSVVRRSFSALVVEYWHCKFASSTERLRTSFSFLARKACWLWNCSQTIFDPNQEAVELTPRGSGLVALPFFSQSDRSRPCRHLAPPPAPLISWP